MLDVFNMDGLMTRPPRWRKFSKPFLQKCAAGQKCAEIGGCPPPSNKIPGYDYDLQRRQNSSMVEWKQDYISFHFPLYLTKTQSEYSCMWHLYGCKTKTIVCAYNLQTLFRIKLRNNYRNMIIVSYIRPAYYVGLIRVIWAQQLGRKENIAQST